MKSKKWISILQIVSITGLFFFGYVINFLPVRYIDRSFNDYAWWWGIGYAISAIFAIVFTLWKNYRDKVEAEKLQAQTNTLLTQASLSVEATAKMLTIADKFNVNSFHMAIKTLWFMHNEILLMRQPVTANQELLADFVRALTNKIRELWRLATNQIQNPFVADDEGLEQIWVRLQSIMTYDLSNLNQGGGLDPYNYRQKLEGLTRTFARLLENYRDSNTSEEKLRILTRSEEMGRIIGY